MKYIFGNANTRSYGVVILNQDGTIGGYDHPNEKFWEIDNNGKLLFRDIYRRITSIFNKVADEYVCENKWHFLRPYHKVFPLTADITQFDTDKFLHSLLEFYESKFKYIKYDKITIVELGCLTGESIKYWLDYFPQARVVGIDKNKVKVNDNRFEFYYVDQNDKKGLQELSQVIGNIDIFIDDGSHFYDETKNTFDAFWPQIKSDGYYVIEDWDWMTDLVTDIIHLRGELGGGIKETRGIRGDIGIKHLEVSTNDNRAYALFQKR